MPTLKHEYTDLDNGSYNADPFLVGGFPYGKNRTAQGGTSLHKLTGSNRDLPLMMKALYPEVDLEVIGAPSGMDPRFFPGMLSDRGPMWDRAKQNTEITLRDGVDVQITQAPTEVSAGVYELKVKVTNKSGHRIPSGYPDGRRFWLSVQANDASGTPVYVSGVYDDATATLKTTTADAFKRSLGNIIDATVAGNNAVQVYERVTGLCVSTDSTRNSTILGAPFVYPEPSVAVGAPLDHCADSPSLLNNFILFDNRIPPKGLNYAAASQAGVKFWNYNATTKVPTEDTARYTTAQLAGGYDEVTYRFTAPTGSTLTASAELYWQTHTRDFVEHLRAQDTSTVRPEGPPNPFNVNYPNVPNYLSDSINGQPLSFYTALDGTVLNDNWGGVAYAAWLATGKGAPFLVKRDDTSITTVPPAPVLAVRALNASDPGYIDPVTLAPNVFAAKFSWTPVANADGYTIWIRYGKDTTGATADWDRLVTVGNDATSHIENVLGDASVNSPGKTYGFKVVAFNGKGETPSAVVTHTVATALPAAPTGLTASSTAPGSTASQITLNWTDNATNEAGFEVWRYGPMSVNGVPIVYNGLPPVAIVGGIQFNAANGGIPSLTDGPLTPGAPTTGPNTYMDTDAALLPVACYNYQVRAVTNNVDVSTWALAANQGCTIAARPTVNLTAAAASGTRVNLTWSSNAGTTADPLANFRISRTGGAAFTPVIVGKSAAATYAFTDITASPATLYAYTVDALNAAGTVLATASAAVTTPAVPLAPTNVTTAATATQITVSWTDNANNEDGFVLERSDNGGIYQQIPAVGSFLAPKTVPAPSAVSYVDTAVLQNVTYQYRVKAIHLVNGDSGYATGTPVSLIKPVSVSPSSLAFGNQNINTISTFQTVTLNNSSGGPLAINLNGITFPAQFARATGANAGTCNSTALLPANRTIANGASCTIGVVFSPTSIGPKTGTMTIANSVQNQTVALSGTGILLAPAVPAVPTVATLTATSLTLNWGAVTGATSYTVQRATDAAFTANVVTTTSTTASLNVTGLTGNTTYYFHVSASNAGGPSAYSGTMTQLTLPNAPTGVAAANGTAGAPKTGGLTWTAPAGGAVSYNVRYALLQAMAVPTTVTSVTSGQQITITVVLASGTRYLQVQAVNASGVSAWAPATPIAVTVQ
jgi:hypothetical protein